MLLAHALVLAKEKVVRAGKEFAKTGSFTAEQKAAEDWEPVYEPFVPPLAPSGDCADCPK